MSSDIYAKPDLSKKVRYNRKVEEDGAEWEEREVNIYESTDRMGDDHTDLQSQEGGPQTQKLPPVQTRPYRAAALCVGVLCLLMMAGIILLSTCYVSVTLEKEQLQTRYNDLNNSYTQLQGQLSDMKVNNSQLQSRYETLSENHSQLQDEVKRLKEKLKEKRCPDGWTRFGCSCYFKSTGWKTWSESRTDCQRTGADLVIINSKEEQEFVSKLNGNGESWIGLTTKQKTRYTWEWEWVDGSPLTETFWAKGEGNYPTYESRAVCCDQQGKWIKRDHYYYYGQYNRQIHYVNKNWMCEK